MKKYIKTMRSCSKKISNVMLKFKGALKEMVKENGGFIDLSDAIVNPNSKYDTICGLALDDNDELREYYMYAIRLTEYDGEESLECFLVPKMNTYIETFTKEDMLSKENNDCWCSLDDLSDRLYQWETLVGLIDYKEEYNE